MRVILATMNEIGIYALEELVRQTEVVAVLTVMERGKLYMDPTDFAPLARKHGIPLIKTQAVNTPEIEARLRELQPDIGMCLGWKWIIKKSLLDIPKLGWLGGHPGKLLVQGERPSPDVFSAPGNEPIQYAIRSGATKTGMSIQWLKEKIDVGELFGRREIALDEHETSATLIRKMGQATADILRENLPKLLAGNPPRVLQEIESQPYTKPLLADGNRIDLSAPWETTYRLIRSEYDPYPNAFIEFAGKRIYIEHARMENGVCTELRVRLGGSPYQNDAGNPAAITVR